MTKQLISLILFFVNFSITIAENHTNDSLILVYDQLLENYETSELLWTSWREKGHLCR